MKQRDEGDLLFALQHELLNIAPESTSTQVFEFNSDNLFPEPIEPLELNNDVEISTQEVLEENFISIDFSNCFQL